MDSGILYICATPIGNLEDITLRVLRILKEVDVIAAEDTRTSQKLLNHYGITTKMRSYHEYNSDKVQPALIALLKEGKDIALISDAGMPVISDPGRGLVRACHEAGLNVRICPGASASASAYALSGVGDGRYVHEGFLPSNKKARHKRLEALNEEQRAMAIYCAPHDVLTTLTELHEHLGDRELAICRELTKIYEETKLMRLTEAIELYEAIRPRGEFVFIIEGKEKECLLLNESVMFHVEHYIKLGHDEKTAMKMVAKDRNVSKREIYDAYKIGGKDDEDMC